MSRHLRLSHTTCQCFWRCPVPSCPMWFASELYGNDHLEQIHNFSEGRGYSFYECLHKFGLEWFGRCSFFDQRNTTSQALWMDLALARKTSQELHNDYVITSSPDFGSLRKLFRAAVRELVHAYIDYPHSKVDTHSAFSACDQIRQDIADSPRGHRRTSPVDWAEDFPIVELPPPLTITSATSPLPVVQTLVRSLTPNNRSLSLLQTGPGEHVQLHVPQSRGAVSNISIASTDLLSHVKPLPMDQLIIHDIQAVCSWADNTQSELFAVARRNLTSLTRYLDVHDAHLAACDGGLDDHIPLMTVETFPRAAGGIQSALAEVDPLTDGMDAVTPTGSLDFLGPGRKLGQCVPARSTLILTICLCPWRA